MIEDEKDKIVVEQANKRKITTDLFCIDAAATNASANKFAKDDLGLLKLVQQGATWDKTLTIHTGTSKNSDCEHCGAPKADNEHTVWCCPALEEARSKLMAQHLPGVSVDMLHKAVRHGIAPATAATCDTTFGEARRRTSSLLLPKRKGPIDFLMSQMINSKNKLC